MAENIYRYNSAEGKRPSTVMLGDIIDDFNRSNEMCDRIVASLLGTVAVEIQRLDSCSYDTALTLKSRLVTPNFTTKDTRADNGTHPDLPFDSFAIGARYITSNHTPTLVDGLEILEQGYIIQMEHGETEHARPAISVSQNGPRLLFGADI